MIFVIIILLVGIVIVGIGIYTNREELTKSTDQNLTLYFKNNESAFEYILKYQNHKLEVGETYVGVVLEVLNKDEKTFTVKLAGNSQDVLGIGLAPEHQPTKGNLISWLLTDAIYNEEIKKTTPIGIITNILNPEYDPVPNTWNIRKKLVSDEIIKGISQVKDFDDFDDLVAFIKNEYECKLQEQVTLYGFIREDASVSTTNHQQVITSTNDICVETTVLLITQPEPMIVSAICGNKSANFKKGDFVAIMPFYSKHHDFWYYTVVAKLQPTHLGRGKGFAVVEQYMD